MQLSGVVTPLDLPLTLAIFLMTTVLTDAMMHRGSDQQHVPTSGTCCRGGVAQSIEFRTSERTQQLIVAEHHSDLLRALLQLFSKPDQPGQPR